GERLALPAPSLSLEVEAVTVGPPGRAIPTLSDVSFAIRAGEALGVIGPSGGGKSTLARALVGVWPLTKGQVRLDASPLPLWPADSLGPHIGYLPQEVQLIAGSIARNIARFEETPAPERVIAAARAAGVHELIMSLSEGYETQVGEDGQALSAGQRQRIALARALYADPFLIVLDEPNSNLDADGEAALSEAIQAVRNRGGVVVVIAHRPSALSATNKILVIRDGRAVSFGPKEEILAGLLPPSAGLGAGLGAGTGGALR
ncbi:MAG TPA: ATP-binding cassette domain-containing protein, partial [Caulobacteraceae bacterium]